MFFLHIFLYCLFIIQICASDTTNLQKDTVIDKTSNNSHTLNLNNELPIAAEGGTIILNNKFSNQTETNLNNLEKEVGNVEQKSVVGRKGVVYEENKAKSFSSNNNSSIKDIKPVTVSQNDKLNKAIVLINNTTKLNDTVHKPEILSYEALSQTDAKNKVVINENEPSIKVHAMSASSHPGMIMPIVITILVVPMFAVVGYMALKRGKEAWKNRHYKRMDFLLDGMYND